MQGKSLVKFLSGNKQENSETYAYTVSYQGKDGSIRTNRWRYTRWGANTENNNEELYDHENDPEENVNLADSLDYQNILNQMRLKFEEAKQRTKLEITK